MPELRLTVLTFIWGPRYDIAYVDRLGEGLRRYLDVPYRFVCVTDRPRQFGRTVTYQERLPNPELAGRHCFCRLRIFDPTWQQQLGLAVGDRILVPKKAEPETNVPPVANDFRDIMLMLASCIVTVTEVANGRQNRTGLRYAANDLLYLAARLRVTADAA